MKRGYGAQQSKAAGREEANERMLDLAAQSNPREGIRQALEDVNKGRSRPLEEFFREFEANHDL
jgi:hypothetical protein